MERTLKLVGKTSNEIFLLRYPSTLLDFCDFELSEYAKGAVELCNDALKTGSFNGDRVAELRNDIQNAHCYVRYHIRTVYEKLYLDCWIDYVCRRDNIGEGALWNRYAGCRTPFEKAVFARLCDYRYNRDINQWHNLVRVQDYARTKRDFIFTESVSSAEDAAARRNYFDLMFSVTAREMGCRIEELGVTKVFPVGRIPTAPFMFSSISKEIVRHVLADFDYSEDYSDVESYEDISDRIAMDAFSRMKEGLPQDLSGYGITKGKLDNYPDKIYMPCSLKAAVDLEIDAVIESGAWLAKCRRCGRSFLKDNEHTADYCSRYIPNGKTCLELWEEANPVRRMTPALEQRCSEVTDEIYQRVDKTMSVKEYESWRSYLDAMKRKVDNGEIAPDELEDFLDYSLEVDITRSHPIVEVPKKEPEQPKKGVVKPFVPERISRSDIRQAVSEPDPEEERALREGFFTSPSKQRRKNEQPQISHIIRGGESLGENPAKADPAGFQPFGMTAAETKPRSPLEELRRIEEEKQPVSVEIPVRPLERRDSDRNAFTPSFGAERGKFKEDYPRAERSDENAFGASGSGGRGGKARGGFAEEYPRAERSQRAAEYDSDGRGVRSGERNDESAFAARHGEPVNSENAFGASGLGERGGKARGGFAEDYPRAERSQRAAEYDNDGRGGYGETFEFTDESDGRRYGEPEPVVRAEQLEPPPAPKPRVIRKNAAAISAYGKIAGVPTSAAPPEMDVTSEPETFDLTDISEVEERTAPQLDEDPFKDIESIFDVLEQSESGMTGNAGQAVDHGDKPLPRAVTKKNAPSGIWTEDRDVFGEQEQQSELDMLKEKKRGKSSKTKHLYDAIMREPSDNPNVRRK
ncbi:MAG: DUF6076 domain-containing protein [Lachnospiraceae bacterium]|nr:DUF6076 domain-containing protein [Ruminococcus sp.]MCM1275933.1 DUF6076 domain-containing protein [Lachnospiraceae bacterium]